MYAFYHNTLALETLFTGATYHFKFQMLFPTNTNIAFMKFRIPDLLFKSLELLSFQHYIFKTSLQLKNAKKRHIAYFKHKTNLDQVNTKVLAISFQWKKTKKVLESVSYLLQNDGIPQSQSSPYSIILLPHMGRPMTCVCRGGSCKHLPKPRSRKNSSAVTLHDDQARKSVYLS